MVSIIRDQLKLASSTLNVMIINLIGTPPSTEVPYGDYPFLVTQEDDPSIQVPIVQVYTIGKYLGRLDVVFDADGKIVEYSGNPILLDGSVDQGEMFKTRD